MVKDYNWMLDRAYQELPEISDDEGERFQVPRVRVLQQGRRSIVLNFGEVAEALRRDPQHLLKFMTGETATHATFDGTRVVFQGRFTQESIQNLVDIYTKRYVICPVCGRPDTHIERDKRLSFLQCDACGAKSSIGKR